MVLPFLSLLNTLTLRYSERISDSNTHSRFVTERTHLNFVPFDPTPPPPTPPNDAYFKLFDKTLETLISKFLDFAWFGII